MTETPLLDALKPLAVPTAGEAAARAPASETEEARLRDAAKRFEQSFIAQMLTHSGLADALVTGGGEGADAYTTFYIDKLAEKLADNGGFGMAEMIYERLTVYRDRLSPDAPQQSDGENSARTVRL